jgi:hypothetical protein
MKLIALLDDPSVVEKILRHLKLRPEQWGDRLNGRQPGRVNAAGDRVLYERSLSRYSAGRVPCLEGYQISLLRTAVAMAAAILGVLSFW